MTKFREPESAIDAFNIATEKVAQVPVQGIVDVARFVVSHATSGEDWTRYASADLTAEELPQAMGSAGAQHRDFSVSVTGLARKMRFAHELVRSGANRAIAVLSRGDDSVETHTIRPVDAGEVAEAATYLNDEGNRSFVTRLFTAVQARLDQDDVRAAVVPYHDGISAISQRFAGVTDPEALREKAELLNAQRGQFMSVAGPAVFEALTPFAEERPGVMAFAGAVACGIPDQALFDKYPQPQA